jgi:hypothetical protein
VDMPLIAPVRQVLNQPVVADLAEEVRRQWQTSQVPKRLKRGDRVLVGVGSRGIANVATMVRATLDVLRDLGTKPAIVAAMGSHGGATSEGQRELLAGYGVSEEALRVPVLTDMTAIPLGTNSWGETVFFDKNASEADALLTISRVKPHTDFRSTIESGICKMLVIGLGKRDGASQHHKYGVRGLRDMLPESAKVILEKSKFVAGLAVLENANEQTAKVQVVHRDEVFAVEPKLLEESRQLMGRLPFAQLDLLVIGEIGKNYSGAGIDPNVVGRLLVEGQEEFTSPRITRICCLDLSPESHGNGTGVGIADLTTERLLASIDPVPFRMNNLTACFLWRSKLPFAFPNDRESIAMGIQTCWQPFHEKLRMAIIPNTLELPELWVSPAVLEEVKANSKLQVTGDLQPLSFDAKGNIDQAKLFPHSVCGRRQGGHHG